MSESTSKKILIVDDEEGVRESLNLVLSDHYDTIRVESGEQALETLANAKDIGLIMMDIKMPKVNGLEVLTQIKSQYPSLKVIMVTGYRFVETATEAVRLGASGYVIKPFKSEEILSIVRKYM